MLRLPENLVREIYTVPSLLLVITSMSVFNRFYRWICYVENGDDFTTALRKVGLVILLLSSPISLAYSCYWFYLGYGSGNQQPLPDGSLHDPLGVQIQAINALLLSVTLVVPYFVGRSQRHVSATMVDIVSIILLLHWTIATITIPDYGIQVVAITIAVFSILSTATYSALYTMYAFLLCLISGWNEAFQRDQGSTLAVLLVPGARLFSPPSEVFIGHVSSLSIFGFAIIGMMLQMKEHHRHLNANEAAVRISREIVDLLRRYDTEGVSTALQSAFADTQTKVDPELLHSFKAMNANLEKYKPHLPNYMFVMDSDGSDADAGDDGGEGDLEQISNVDSGTMRAKVEEEDDEGDIILNESDEIQTLDMSGTLRVRSPTATKFIASTPNSATRPRQLSLPSEDGDNGDCTSSKLLSPTFKGKVCYALVDLVLQQPASQLAQSGSLSGSLTVVDLNQSAKSGSEAIIDESMNNSQQYYARSTQLIVADVINHLHSIAQATKASIHNVVGDTAILSWNATHRVPQPEVKAIRFLHQLTSSVGAKASISAAAFSGQAHCFAMTTLTKQHALIVRAKWLSTLRAAFTRARELQTTLVDSAICSTSTHAYECRAVDAVSMSPIGSTKAAQWRRSLHGQLFTSPAAVVGGHASPLPGRQASHVTSSNEKKAPDLRWSMLYEVVSEISHAEDEWMYQLDRQESKTAASDSLLTTRALFAALKGDLGSAREVLRTVEERFVERKENLPESVSQLIDACDARQLALRAAGEG